MRFSKVAVCGGVLLAAAVQANAGSVDAKLLDMLLANGSISKAQHAELSADLVREQRAEKREAKEFVKEKDFVAFKQLAGWAANTAATSATCDCGNLPPVHLGAQPWAHHGNRARPPAVRWETVLAGR